MSICTALHAESDVLLHDNSKGILCIGSNYDFKDKEHFYGKIVIFMN